MYHNAGGRRDWHVRFGFPGAVLASVQNEGLERVDIVEKVADRLTRSVWLERRSESAHIPNPDSARSPTKEWDSVGGAFVEVRRTFSTISARSGPFARTAASGP